MERRSRRIGSEYRYFSFFLYTFSTHLLDYHCSQYTLPTQYSHSTHPLNTPPLSTYIYYHIRTTTGAVSSITASRLSLLSIHPTHSIYPLNIPTQYTLSTHPLNTPPLSTYIYYHIRTTTGAVSSITASPLSLLSIHPTLSSQPTLSMLPFHQSSHTIYAPPQAQYHPSQPSHPAT